MFNPSSPGMTEVLQAFRQIKTICESVITNLERNMGQNITHRNIGQTENNQTEYRPVRLDYFNQVQNSSQIRLTEVEKKGPQQIPEPRIMKKGSKKSSVSRLKPKAPLTPYFLFFNRKRPQIQSKYPHLSQAEMANVAGQVWRALTSQEKQIYEKQYRINKAEYQIKIKKFYEEYPDERPLKLKRQDNQDEMSTINDAQSRTGGFGSTMNQNQNQEEEQEVYENEGNDFSSEPSI